MSIIRMVNESLGEGYTVLHRFRHGNAGVFLCLRSDSYIGRSVGLFGEYSEAEVDVFRWFVREDDVVIDAGALFGEHTLALAMLCPRGSVLAFEPQRIPFQILCGNVQLNSIANVDAVKSALGAADGVSSIPSYDPSVNCPWGLARLESPHMVPRRGEVIRVRTIDGLALPRLNFIKLDIEGYELDALRGASATIARCRPVIYLEFNENRAAIAEWLRSAGYLGLFRHFPAVHRYPNWNGVGLDGEEVPHSDMLLAFPEGGRAGVGYPLTLAKFLTSAGFQALRADTRPYE
jgi:FkbM family methyltransferase